MKIWRFSGSILAVLLFIGGAIKYGEQNSLKASIAGIAQPTPPGYQLIVSNPERGVYVYGKKIEGKNYFDKVLVKTRTGQKEFDWKATTRNPQLTISDISGAGGESIEIVFVTSLGTGLYQTQVHVIDMGLTKEYPVEEPALAAKRLISPRIEGQEIVFTAGGQEYRVRPRTGPGGIEAELRDIMYGSFTSYRVENNILKAYVSVQGTTSNIWGDFILAYTYQGGKLVPHVEGFKSAE